MTDFVMLSNYTCAIRYQIILVWKIPIYRTLTLSKSQFQCYHFASELEQIEATRTGMRLKRMMKPNKNGKIINNTRTDKQEDWSKYIKIRICNYPQTAANSRCNRKLRLNRWNEGKKKQHNFVLDSETKSNAELVCIGFSDRNK